MIHTQKFHIYFQELHLDTVNYIQVYDINKKFFSI